MKKVLTTVSMILLTTGNPSMASMSKDLPEVGEHFPILIIEKSENPQNIMVIYTKMNSNCQFQETQTSKPLVDFYWLMDRKKFKPVHPLIKRGIRERLVVQPSKKKDSFYVRIQELEEVDSDIEDPRFIVETHGEDKCQVKASIKLGPSDKNKVIELESIYSETKKTIKPPFRKLLSVTLAGMDPKTGQKVERTYEGK